MDNEEIKDLALSINAEIIETHISWVLITSKFVYKIKKPIKNSFLDFSTLNKRKYYCKEELRLNKEFSQSVYLKVIPIKKEKSISFNNRGKTIDYALKMKALDQNKILAYLLKNNKVKKSEIARLAKLIATIHSKARIINKNKIPSLLHEFKDLLLEANHSIYTSNATKNEIARLNQKAQLFLSSHKYQFEKRKKDGMIKEIHGDLHSKNIFMNNPPVLFDRIEFNKEFRRIDILNEIAFVCMDLEFNSHPELSDAFLKTYIKEMAISFDKEERQIFLFYKAYVANVRAKVNLLRAGQKDNEGKKYINQFKKYFLLMRNYMNELD